MNPVLLTFKNEPFTLKHCACFYLIYLTIILSHIVSINCAALGHFVKYKRFIIYTILGDVSQNRNNDSSSRNPGEVSCEYERISYRSWFCPSPLHRWLWTDGWLWALRRPALSSGCTSARSPWSHRPPRPQTSEDITQTSRLSELSIITASAVTQSFQKNLA